MEINYFERMQHQGYNSVVTSPAAAGSNDTAVNSIAQELVRDGMIEIRLIQDYNLLIRRLMEINYFERMQH